MDFVTTLFVVIGVGTVLGAGLIFVGVRREGWRRRALPWVAVIAGGLSLAVAGVVGYETWANWASLTGPKGPTAEELASPVGAFPFHLVADDRPASLADHRGKVVLVNIWATWCGPCVAEMPRLERLQEDFGADGLVVITLTKEDRETVLPSLPKLPTNTVNAYTRNRHRLPQPFQRSFRVYPTTYVIDRDGYIREYFTATRPYERFVGYVQPYL
jgi:thiol-disulfide isomerase/thioredoxin